MILVTVGTQLTFDRLIKAVEAWHHNHKDFEIIYQVGKNGYKPALGGVYEYLEAKQIDQLQSNARLVIGHAGIGTILSRLSIGRPVVILPRQFEFGEHRNDHQIATARKFSGRSGVYVAYSESELANAIDQALDNITNGGSVGDISELEISKFIRDNLGIN
ncbi:glycosyltransferase [Nitrincola lacisaponensis]|uniref:glycosyltransferase n=1 Tax=Nitrincola lacisaponensis TaxID=267850 RepID=UPI00068C9617|nr:glycosyltransferase [Nitrincola lacisaponensis]